ncbi:Carbon starvation protein A [Mycobacterium talmoniae]|uniref:Carbon starvation protein A n=1 Tax=Mycobacterium talmoniae TaxID=1858794 RepID=A0A2S8BGP0_9MYCO|nr:Carbon starvation protein A [Mycobacterium talmoniae]
MSRTGGAPTLAFGMSEVLHRVFGGAGLKAFWYHFAIMFEALFILTTVDAGTRVARFMLSDALSNLGGPLRRLRDPSWRAGAWGCSLVMVAAWGGILLMGVTDPLGGINTLFPLFGIANQLLAAIALTVVTVVVIKQGKLKWAWIPGLPLLADLAVTLSASWQKIFSADPRVGYWAQHFQYRAAQRAGAAHPDQLDAVIRNTFIQGTLSALFAAVVVVVVAAGVLVALRAIRGQHTPAAEEEPVASRRFAPAGLIPTTAEREVQAQWAAHAASPPDRLVLGNVDGRHALPALPGVSPPRPSGRAGALQAGLLAAPLRRRPRRPLLLTTEIDVQISQTADVRGYRPIWTSISADTRPRRSTSGRPSTQDTARHSPSGSCPHSPIGRELRSC